MADKKQNIVVYTAGVWDMFHIGHLNLLKAARALGDILINVPGRRLLFNWFCQAGSPLQRRNSKAGPFHDGA
ncbi:MAG: adenylyltransferase/cytidyltransferase family protein [Desulfobacteraceae bacterium]